MSQDADGKGVQIKLHSSMFSAGIVGHSKHHLCWQPQPCYSLRMANLISPVALLVSKTIHLPAVQRSIPPPSHQLGLQAHTAPAAGHPVPFLGKLIGAEEKRATKTDMGLVESRIISGEHDVCDTESCSQHCGDIQTLLSMPEIKGR